MARLAQRSPPSDDDESNERYPDSNLPVAPSHRAHRRVRHPASLSPPPELSYSSDKENHGGRTHGGAHQKDPKSRPTTMTTTTASTPGLRTPSSNSSTTPRAGRKRRFGDDDGDGETVPLASHLAHERELDEAVDTQYYDPDQSMEERRAVRKGLRDLARDLNGARELSDLLSTIPRTPADRCCF